MFLGGWESQLIAVSLKAWQKPVIEEIIEEHKEVD